MTRSKLFSALLAASYLLPAAPALAAPDLRVEIPAPAPQHVHDLSEYDVVVTNVGKHSAAAVVLTITLPATHTSPQTHVMGTLADVDSRCTAAGTKLVCALGTIGKNQSKVVAFAIALPVAAEVLAIAAAVTTSSGESNLADNAASDAPTSLYYDIDVPADALVHNRHCTGTGLTSFFECELFPSSISGHDVVLHGDGTLTLVDAPDLYSGFWWQDTPDSLGFVYLESGQIVAEFHGFGANPDCFEGLTTFPGSAYVSPYEVCL
jgi:hypothetical protein